MANGESQFVKWLLGIVAALGLYAWHLATPQVDYLVERHGTLVDSKVTTEIRGGIVNDKTVQSCRIDSLRSGCGAQNEQAQRAERAAAKPLDLLPSNCHCLSPCLTCGYACFP